MPVLAAATLLGIVPAGLFIGGGLTPLP